MKKTELKIGDTVTCIDDSYSFRRLRVGDKYEVVTAYDGSPVVIVTGAAWNLERFVKCDNIKNEEVKKC